jgi:Osmosensitive K+ channel histidine kinase
MTEPATTDMPGVGRTSEPGRAPATTDGTGAYLDRVPMRGWARYGIAVGLTVVAWLVTLALLPHVERVVFVFFWPAVLISAVLGGLGPALVASLLATRSSTGSCSSASAPTALPRSPTSRR